MLSPLLSLLLASSSIAGFVPRLDSTAISGNVKNDTRRGVPKETFFQSFDERGIFGPIATDSAVGIAGGQVTCGSPPVSSFFADLNPPFPTNSCTDREWDGTSIKQPTHNDWRVSFAEHSGAFENHKAIRFDTQTVSIQYFQGRATMTAYLVPGSPYLTLQYNAATPLLTPANGGIQSFNGKTLAVGESESATGTEFTVTDTKGTTYLVYALSSVTLTATSDSSASGTIRASAPFTGVLRLVMLAEAGHKPLLDQYYQVYPTAVELDYAFTDTTGTLIFTWDTVGDGSKLLMLTWPHHRLTMQEPNFPSTTSLGYLTTKGWMYPALGNQWRMLHELTSISWNPPRAVDSSCSSAVLQGLEYEVAQLDPSEAPVPGDFYYWGGTLAAKARLALIAENLGRSDLITPVIDYLETSFNYWFESSSPTVPAYETAWGGVIDKAGATDANVDFGNGYYNDHHFHYGYFLTVAAVIGKFDGTWLSEHKDYINWFARDIINPSPQDPYFPITRCRDWFAGHSWASGIANGAGSRDQESSGEAVNAYYGALLWASTTLSQDYVNYAKLLIATEQQASQLYWHLYPEQSSTDRDNPYPEPEVRDLITIGNVEDWQSGAWLFWGAEKSEIAAIQILPLIPVNEVLYDTQWVQNVWSYTMPELVDPTIGDEWKCVIIAAYSNANPQVAAAWSANITDWGTGNTYTNELFFIGTRPNPSGTPICQDLPQNPYGTFKLQVASSGAYVAASSADTNLVASATTSGDAATFTSGYVPNAGTLQLASTGQYVTADQSGDYTLAAIRTTASTWERFIVRQKVGAASGVYSVKAASNGLYVTVASDGYWNQSYEKGAIDWARAA
ncbi:Glycoside hydrolase family 81 protein [Pleurostoma richardsiae]|uniref:glucan endo-1,3-beta-D-glucosidase n=1 Tax=Pleurostoma richardsiae TaxID=41990 RepID=A0AA38RDF5_9PEZI|nr:Glycoside hydrolase family 81 protein [Pleurostoma richardsiae]